jgi:SAM-dependent methyltransferase
VAPRIADDTAATWPFWAPSRAEAVATALHLADVRPSERLLDLGCGDGQVLLLAAERGAQVAGIEADAGLVEQAREHLADAGIDADVRVGDLFDPDLDLDADVFFAYLAPATLQRLLPTLARRRGARLVTVDFAVPGLVPTKRSDPARLYLLPGRRGRTRAVGWPCPGTLISTVTGHQSLSCLDLVHPAGPTRVRPSRPLQAVATVFSGAERLDATATLAVDVRWEPMTEGTVVGGEIGTAAGGSHAVFVIATDEADEGMWELTGDAVDALRRALRRRRPPSSLAGLLDAAEGRFPGS